MVRQKITFRWQGTEYELHMDVDDRRSYLALPDGTVLVCRWIKVGNAPWQIDELKQVVPLNAIKVV